jgi:methylated-DNA-protein-cysteine methyltransferase-like protein
MADRLTPAPRRRRTGRPARSLFRQIYAIVRRVPRGRVTTYGEVARLAGLHGGARTVGWAMAAVPGGQAVPWWRVIRADGTVAPRPAAGRQRRRLAAEGVRFGRAGRVDLRRYGWPSGKRASRPDSRRRATHAASAATPHTAAESSTAIWAPNSDASDPANSPPSGPVPNRAST